jgi:hypothetical protein
MRVHAAYMYVSSYIEGVVLIFTRFVILYVFYFLYEGQYYTGIIM